MDYSEEAYCDHLDSVYGTLNVAGIEYGTGQAQYALDKTAFRQGFNDWLDAELDSHTLELQETIEYLDDDEQQAIADKMGVSLEEVQEDADNTANEIYAAIEPADCFTASGFSASLAIELYLA